MEALWPASGPMAVSRGGMSIVFDERPALIRDKQGMVVGVDAMVRVFRAGNELRVDPHRICINPPMMVPDGTFRDTPDGPVSNFREDPVEAYLTWLVESLRDVPNAKGWRTKGTVTTFYAETSFAGGRISSVAATYSSARAGSGTLSEDAGVHEIGQDFVGDYYCYQSFITFLTSSLGSDTVSQVDFALYGQGDYSTTDFTIECREYSAWDRSLSTGDFIAGASLSSQTLLASRSSSGFTTSGYNTFTESGTNFQSAINGSGYTSIICASANQTNNVAPTGAEWVRCRDADTVGTTQDPKLTITHAASTVTANGALATVTVAGLAGTATVNTLATGALASVTVAGYAGTETHGTTAAGGLATVSVAGLAGAATYVVTGAGGLATVTVDGYGGEAGRIVADGAVAAVDVAGYAGTVTYDVSGAGAVATVDVAGYAGTVTYDVSGASGLATVTVAGLDGTGTYVVSGTGALGTVDVAGYAGETTVAVGGAGDVALVTVAGYAGAASHGVASEGALALVTVVGYAGRQLNRFVSGRRPRPGSGRFFGSGPGAGRFSPGRG